MTRTFHTSDFDFALPPELIAQTPAPQRAQARLLDGRCSPPVDRIFSDLPTLLRRGDLLVFNDTRVVKARLFGVKPTGGKVEILVERVLGGRQVAAHVRAAKKLRPGTIIDMEGRWQARALARWPDEGGALVRLELSGEPYALMQAWGHVPLPPYIEHSDAPLDLERYQSVFASKPGAVAAPTASLHFDQAVLVQLREQGIEQTHITLHVGAGTFAPIRGERLDSHRMHSERYWVGEDTVQALAACRQRAGRIVAVGTTSVRALESWAIEGGASKSGASESRGAGGGRQAETNIFITPGFEFKVVDLLITNFHLPRSTLMMLVSAFAGWQRTMELYAHAVAQRYRFFSYGDAMLLERAPPMA